LASDVFNSQHGIGLRMDEFDRKNPADPARGFHHPEPGAGGKNWPVSLALSAAGILTAHAATVI
jgi:hypothetical protein